MESTVKRGREPSVFWVRVGLWLSLALLCCGTYYFRYQNHDNPFPINARQLPPLQIDASFLDFGEVLGTSLFHWKLRKRGRSETTFIS